MEIYCQFCGSGVKVSPPYATDYRYMERRLKKARKANKSDKEDKKLIIVPRLKKGVWEDYVVGEWSAKSGMGSWHGDCSCGKKVFHIKDMEQAEFTTLATRSNINDRNIVEVKTSGTKLFELGVHWYNLPFTDKTDNAKQLYQLGLWN